MTRKVLPAWTARFACGTALLCLAAAMGAASVTNARAQDASLIEQRFESNPDAQMLLQSDQLIYNNDVQTISAVGSVQIEYDGNRLVADRVVYDQTTGRMKAIGNVEIVERDGNRIYADNLDITDDFREGFVNALRVESADNTRFAAESAVRTGGQVTTFNNGVYTACEPCKENPEKPPLWQIKAQKIIWNGEKKTIRFERGRFELFGMPLITLPAFEIPDPTVKRKSGFLMPTAGFDTDLGFSVTGSYFWALAPNYDLTLSGTGYTKQGFLTQAEWRHRLENGTYNLRIAGIHQQNPDEFDGAVDRNETNRGFVASQGEFDINTRWKFGWDVFLQSDKNFAYTYGLEDYSDYREKSEVYLTGLSGRNYFDLRFYKFQIQESLLNSNPNDLDPTMPWVLPSWDYSYTPSDSVFGGELNFDMNVQGINRSHADVDNGLTNGVEGTSGRLTAEAEWKRTFITDGGLVLTPLLALRGDGIGVNSDTQVAGAVVRSEAFRGMATAGMEVRWPILFSTTSATHVLEPIAQLYMRNNESYAGRLPNEDAQSFVFDATTLFQRDKFSGYDRIEGGHRANLGLRYSGTLGGGWTLDALAGQSFHLGGLNSFATSDFVNAGAESGLETDRSDYVAMVGASNSRGLSVALRGRFDEEDLELRRGEVAAQNSNAYGSLSLKYAFIDEQPTYGFTKDRHEVTVAASANVNANWRVFGASTYDFVSETLVQRSAGLAYDDECFTYQMTYTRDDPVGGETKQSFGVFVSLRTLGDFGRETTLSDMTN